MRTILVTGGAGFIGSNFVRQWIAEEEGLLVNLDKLTYAGNLESLADIESSPRHTFIHGDIGRLPFRDGYFSVVAISFAFRNITYSNPLRDRYLAEVLRVLSEGGRFIIVETSQPPNPLLRTAFHTYLRWFVSGLGSFLSGHRGAYRYLAESARRFYTPNEVASLLKNAGFREVHTSPMLGGIAAIHVAVR